MQIIFFAITITTAKLYLATFHYKMLEHTKLWIQLYIAHLRQRRYNSKNFIFQEDAFLVFKAI